MKEYNEFVKKILSEISFARQKARHLNTSVFGEPFHDRLMSLWRNIDWALDCIEGNEQLLNFNLLPLVSEHIVPMCEDICRRVDVCVKQKNYQFVYECLISSREFVQKLLLGLKRFNDNRAVCYCRTQLLFFFDELTRLAALVLVVYPPEQHGIQNYSLEQKINSRTPVHTLQNPVRGEPLNCLPPVVMAPPQDMFSLPPQGMALQKAKSELATLLLQMVGNKEQGSQWQTDEYQLWKKVAAVIRDCEKKIKRFLEGQWSQECAHDEDFKATKSFRYIGRLPNYLNNLSIALKKISSLMDVHTVGANYVRRFLERINQTLELAKQLSLFTSSSFSVPLSQPSTTHLAQTSFWNQAQKIKQDIPELRSIFEEATLFPYPIKKSLG